MKTIAELVRAANPRQARLADAGVKSKGGEDMKRSYRWYSVMPCLFLLFVTMAIAGETNTRTYSLADHGSLHLQIPITWADQVRQPPGQLPPTVTFSQKTGDSFKMLITPLWAANKEIVLPDGDSLRQMVQQSAQRASAQAVEKSIEVKEMKGNSGIGFYFSATDRAPKPGEYKYMTQGIIRIGELMTTFTILTNEGQEMIISDALLMLKTAKYNKRT
jgi:hypothetical protein